MLLLVVVIGLCAPITVPRLMGYDIYEVVSGSMEPALPVGSAVYVKDVEPSAVQEGDIIAFDDGSGVITHRVLTNRTSMGQLVTKGDANDVEDLSPVPYNAVMGRVETCVPFVGTVMALYASTAGKVYLLLTAACGVMLNVLASRMRADRRARRKLAADDAAARAERAARDQRVAAAGLGAEELAASGAAGAVGAAGADGALGADFADAGRAPSKKRASRIVWRVVFVVALVVFVGSSGALGFIFWQYAQSDSLYNDATARFTNTQSQAGAGITTVPKSVDFDALRAQNPDVVGWIYCEGTRIDYPVVHGANNDYYLHRDYTGAENINGSIFIDCDNAADFSHLNTIVYGHHMNSGSMFATLEKWADQAYYDEHPVMWLLTPTQNYQVVLFSGRHVSARSDVYQIIADDPARLAALVQGAVEDSDFKPRDDVQLDLRNHFIMLSTCAYVFDDARYVLHGMLVPVM